MADRERALRLRLEGHSYRQIGEALNISRQRAQQITSPPKAIRHHVVTQANGACQSCGIYVGNSGHVHHQTSIGGTGDNYNDIANLILLCPRCHLVAHYGEGPRYQCQACGNTWVGRPGANELSRSQPVRCPRCSSTAWNKPRE